MYSLFDAAMLTQQPSPKDRKRVNAESIVSASSCASRSRPAVLPSASRSGLERRRLQCYLALLLGDIAMLVSAFVFGGWIYQGSVGVESGLILVQLVIPVFLTGALYNIPIRCGRWKRFPMARCGR